MPEHPSYHEDASSQIPALVLLQKLGPAQQTSYSYLTPEEALALRGGRRGNVILEEILLEQLPKVNTIQYKGEAYDFSTDNLHAAVQALKGIPLDKGLVATNEEVYNLLTLGKSLTQVIRGDRRSYNLRYIDWEHPENNVYHVTDEFEVERTGSHETARPDIVCFVNGIPFIAIECKRPDLVVPGGGKPVDQAISQMIRNQKDEYIPRLFVYAQAVLGLAMNDARYATVGSGVKFWTLWREQEDVEAELKARVDQPLPQEQFDRLFHPKRPGWLRDQFTPQGPREVTEQDRMLYALCRPERLLELVYRYVVYDKGERKIARYPQYFAIQETLKRVRQLDEEGRRKGGVIWHTTGTGKSITMVMLSKALALELPDTDPRVVLVTDRIDLDDQIHKTFRACGKDARRARTGRHLIQLLEDTKVSIVTTVIDKFDRVMKLRKQLRSPSENIFVLVDESHRGQYGITATAMRRVFPKACYIGYTGTPLMKVEKNTAERFGGIIHAYTIDQAQKDDMVVPLLYEGRMAVQEVNREALDRWFERVTRNLTREQKTDLKKKFARSEKLSEADQRLQVIAYDISEHYANTWEDTPFKAQLATSSRVTALRYKEFFDDFGLANSEVVISAPDTREGHEEVDQESKDKVQQFWKRMMKRFGSEKAYVEELTAAFRHGDEIDILIVVDKLLTGFDAPRNTVLYVDKSLKEHNLIQAISRVNRLHEGKEHGYVIDYRGILGELDTALEMYSALSAYDPDDVKTAIKDIAKEIAKLPQHHTDLLDIFKTLPDPRDKEACERYLGDEAIRDKFYESLSRFARTLKMAMSSVDFIERTPERTVKTYLDDFRFYNDMRRSVKYRYNEAVDFREYDDQIKKLIDTHVTSSEVEQITEQLDIHDKEKREEELVKTLGEAARADRIAHRLKATIAEKMEDDPAYYQRFSKLVQKAIDEWRDQRITEREYYLRLRHLDEQVGSYTEEGMPDKLKGYESAKAYYHVVREPLARYGRDSDVDDVSAEVGIEIEKIIRRHKVVDWVNNADIQNAMLNEIDDFLYTLKNERGFDLTTDEMDQVLESVIEIARRWDK